MVKIAHIFLAFMALLGANAHFAFSQSDYGDFQIIDGQIIWQHVYETDLDSASVMAFFPKSNYTEENYKIDYRKYGISYMSASFVLSKGSHQFDVIVQVKDGKYRVTCSDFLVNMNFSLSYGMINESSGWDPLEDYLLSKKRELKTGAMPKQITTVYSKSLLDHFDFLQRQLVTSDDW